MTRKRHYHPLAALRFLRKTVLLCLLPLANALLEFSLSALLTALRQDAALLLFLCGASWVLLEASSWALDDAGVLRLRWAFAAKQERILRGEALAALTIERPLLFRLMGASRVVLYPVGQPAKRAVTLYLYKEDAQELADRLMPICDPVCHRPAGGERAAMARAAALMSARPEMCRPDSTSASCRLAGRTITVCASRTSPSARGAASCACRMPISRASRLLPGAEVCDTLTESSRFSIFFRRWFFENTSAPLRGHTAVHLRQLRAQERRGRARDHRHAAIARLSRLV